MAASLSLGERAPLAEGDLQLPRPPGVIRRFWARHPWLTDSLVAAVYLLISAIAITVLITPAGQEPARIPVGLVILRVVVTLATTAAFVFRRRKPVTVLIIACVGTVVAVPFEGALDTLAIPIALYAIAVYRSSRDAWLGFAGSLVASTLAAYLSVTPDRQDVVPFGAAAAAASSQFAAVMLIATLIGTNIGNRKRYVAALVERANQLARERDQQAQLAAAAERSRIAREMHDIVSHSLTVMVTLADGSAAAASTSPARATEAMLQVAETGRHALTDMRRMLGVLHAGDTGATGELSPQPGTAQLGDLVGTFRSAGLPVRFSTTGRPPDDLTEQLTTYRIVQEALTNVLRHAGAVTAVTVELQYDAQRTVVCVTDDGRGTAVPGSGRGLVGMRERVTLHGGTLESGPHSPRGWRVLATLPRTGDPS